MIDRSTKKINEGVNNINTLFIEYKKYIDVKKLLKDKKINTPINDRLIKEVNKIFFPDKSEIKVERITKERCGFFWKQVR